MKWTAMILALLLVPPVTAARAAGPDAAATKTIEDCIKTAAPAVEINLIPPIGANAHNR